MTDLATHIKIFKELRYIPNYNFIKMLWHIATEHGEETTLEDFIKAISPATTTTDKKE
jgi:thioredoxin-related protein